jgi:tRNA-2-methylthio-N6-dimethylallyladenosine synthase
MVQPARFFIHSFGCQMNKLDSELVESKLVAAGYQRAPSEASADVVLLNTCSVREHAEHRVWSHLGVLRQRKRAQPGLVVGVLGCMAEEHQHELQARMPHVDLVVGTSAFGDIDVKVDEARRRSGGVVAVGEGVSGDRIERDVRLRPHRSQAWVSVMRGCNMPCSYCIVPRTRGDEVSRPIAQIVAEARRLADDGVTEITLLGQTVNAYGRDLGNGVTLAALLHALHAGVPALHRIAFITSHPNFVSPELIDALAGLPKVARYLHLPAQSGSNAVLKSMRRGYTVERYLQRVEDLLARAPDFELHSDFIVGYPGETEADVERTAALIERVRFAQSYVFKYSPRPGTLAAASLRDDVPDQEKERRHQLLLAVQERASRARDLRHVGSVQEVLVEGRSPRGGWMAGRTAQHRIVHFAGDDDLVGRYVQVQITRANAHSLAGELCVA